ncbi:MAG TPA: radical SAM protein [Selenomonadales bacterium]|nr:radical SAM protein [Selenomonadales bacterium]
MEALELLAQEGWRIRERNFRPAIRFSYPNGTQAISVTGGQCALNCAHCGGHYLQGMKALQDIPEGAGLKARSLLISGGCDAGGRVPVAEHLAKIAALKRGLRCNVHVGLVGENDIRQIAGIADTVSFDFIGEDATIKEVLGMDRTVSDYVACYRQLKKRCSVIPHICIGLHGGEVRGEYRALRHLKALGAEGITFIVFTPTKGTRFADRPPPAVGEVLSVLVRARQVFPAKPLQLGCMRPGGLYRRQLDWWAVRCGVNGIVNPAPEAVRLAEELGLTVERREECCVL